MTLNFDDFISNFWLTVAILLALLFLFLLAGQHFRALMWKQRCTETALERDDYAQKYFELRESQLSELRIRARLETSRETRLAQNLAAVLDQHSYQPSDSKKGKSNE